MVLSVYGSCGDVESVEGRALRVRALGTEMRMCAPPAVAAAASDRS
ncbi:hypothetical protein ACFXJ5_33745 [Streptomyces sp. NPDC059373]